MPTLAQLSVLVTAETAAAEAGLRRVSGLLGLGGPLALGAVAAGAAVVGLGVAATKMAGDFQSGLTSLVTGAGESQKNLAAVSDGILNLAVSTGTSTKQLIDGMYMIESAGFHGKAGLDVLKAAAEGAKVGNADLGTVADATTTILKDYPGVMNGASGAVNALIATVASGKTHMADLAGAMAMILPTASAAKVRLNDVMGAMATMTGEGVPAANAATYLRQTILALDAPGGKAVNALKSIGLSSADVAAEMQKSLPGALQMITDHLAKKFPVGSAAYVAALKDITGGSKQMQGVLDLTGTHLKDFQTNVGGIAGAVKKGGSSIAGWGLVQGDFNQKMAVLGEVVQTSMIRLGTGLLPIASRLATLFATVLPPAINAVGGAFQAIGGAIQGVIGFFQDTGPAATAVKLVLGILAGAMLGMAASAIPAAIAGISASVVAFGAQAVAAGAAAVATLAAAAPFLLIGAAIGAVIGIVILAVTHWSQITEALGHFKDMLGHVLSGLGTFIGNFLGAIGAFFGNVIGAVTGFVGNVVGAYIGLYAKLIDLVVGFAASFVGHIVSFVGTVVGKIAGFVGLVIGAYIGLYAKLIGLVIGFVGNFVGHIASMASSVLGKVASFVGQFLGKIGGLKDTAIQRMKDLASGFMSALAGLPGQLLALGLQLMQQFAQGIKNGAGAVASAVKSVPVLGGVAGGVGNALGFIGDHLPGHAAGGPASGLFVGAEQGPELLLRPGVYNAPPGSYVLNNQQTRAALSTGGLGGHASGPAIGAVHIHGADANQVLSLLRRESLLLRMAGRI